MRRRHFIGTGLVTGAGLLTGCIGLPDGESPDSGEQTDGTDPDDTTDGTDGEDEPSGELSVTVEPSASEIEWGEEYSIDISIEAGSEPVPYTGVVYSTEDETGWTSAISGTKIQWMLESGESQTKSLTFEPPAVGELTLGLLNSENNVMKEWDLTVVPPEATFGEAISYYDGLDMTIDVELQDWIDVSLEWEGEDFGVNSVRPNDGQWVKISITAENTNTTGDVSLPEEDAFSALAANSQLDRPRSLGTEVGEGYPYEVQDDTVNEDVAWMEFQKDGEVQEEGFWYPTSDLIPGAVEEGWMVFETDMDTTVEDVQIRLEREGIFASWESA